MTISSITVLVSKIIYQSINYIFIFQTMSKQEVWKFPNISRPGKPTIYQQKPSLLDVSSSWSALNKSDYRGLFNLVIIFGTIFLFTQPTINFIQKGQFLQPNLYNTFKKDLVLCLMTWPLFSLWSFTSFFLQKFVLMGMNQKMVTILQHLTQSGLFIFSTVIILNKNWCVTHSAFVIMQACVHFMKMHSFTTVNRDYREEYLQAKSKNKQAKTDYPSNMNIKNFCLFMITPLLVYDNYPRKSNIDLVYLIKKGIMIVICILVAYIIHTQYIMIWIEKGDKISFIQLLLREMLPSTILLLILFYIVFECITNFFAQISLLNHRVFYDDWWNSTTYEQFNRKWNKPVHHFLYRHVYLELIVRHGISKKIAQISTFLFSALLHQFLLALMFRTVRPIFLTMILFQIPLIYSTKWMVGTRIGNYLYWFGIIIGPSLIISCYLRVDKQITYFFSNITDEVGEL